MTTAIIGTGGLGSVIARQLATGGETLLQGAGAVILALRFTVLKDVIDEIAAPLAGKLAVVPSNPLTTDAHGNVVRVLPQGQPSGKVVAGWLPAGAHLAMAFGTLPADLVESASNRSPEPAVLFYVTDDDRAGQEVERLIRTASFEPVKAGGTGQSGRLEVGGVGPARGRRRPSRSRRRPRTGTVTDRRPLMLSFWQLAGPGGRLVSSVSWWRAA